MEDTKEVREALQRLPTSIKASLASNIAAVEMAYRAGVADGMAQAKEEAA